MQIKDLLQQATQQLAEQSNSDSTRLDAELLLAHCLQKPRSYLFTWPEVELKPEQQHCFEQLMTQRLAGQPVAYLLGQRNFWDLTLKVTPDTLIPRPETELLVETALALLAEKPQAQILETGTGSGAIAIALARAMPTAQLLASDISLPALKIAKTNSQSYELNNIHFMHSDWLKQIPPKLRFDLIISNPPYISANDPHLQQGDVRFEPLTALTSGADGLDAIRQLIKQSPAFLKPGGVLMFEHGYQQGKQTTALMQAAGFFQVCCRQDLAGHDRITLGHVRQ